MLCKLCKQERKLIKAHIVPKFLYEKMKDEKNRFNSVSFNIGDFENHKVKITQMEDYDPNILCQDCDNRIFGIGYERYAKNMLYGTECLTNIDLSCQNYVNPDDGAEYSICENFDYVKFKNFLLSILWRASITERPSFSEVSLGEKHNERIRKILYENLETDEDEYPIIITSFIRTENKFEDLISNPYRNRTKCGLNFYMFMINGYQFYFFIKSSDQKIPTNFKKMILTKKKLIVSHWSNGMELEIINRVFKK